MWGQREQEDRGPCSHCLTGKWGTGAPLRGTDPERGPWDGEGMRPDLEAGLPALEVLPDPGHTAHRHGEPCLGVTSL